ncbi:MAG: DUF4922 domain-containing protein [Dysgonamonadaceae bacterium]|jgi:ATP adenylyltransferase/5',5'''-P-1,P-4-tetraphosphate phosphorylase II|nr:DUF4922 domain-containing protein [Dysgonamonadaceae bacterium]MDD3309295.1 DUF4922 domain-containing protein [Dysgonamonadaceae bacterium]MDD3900637.1 DUF4922 domain-containing protein [Dysgonamonadaceae bacterium]MDD4399097.1 DUF4922 domain-containing protein [Dysgonamonadaceae bacterium]MEA5081478.1 DUF4922 domain-containing protein [Dysgonamonadaceae bacterium]
MDLQSNIQELYNKQQEEWESFRNAVKQLDNIRVKQFNWGDNVKVNIQFNPGRITSTSAKVDKKNIEQRPCFLCEQNRPTVQKGLSFLDKYTILVNPYPILRNHLTIPIHSHVPQRIRKKIGDMLSLSEQLPDYIVFYNGPKSGASAPDHFHLQAGLKSPVLLQGENELRSCLVVEATTKTEAMDLAEDVYLFLQKQQPEEDEPMLNIISFMDNDKYMLHIFPRKAHRPKQYFIEGSKQLLISPGALDMAGLIITPREEDFDKIQKDDIVDIFSQVSMLII